MLVPVITAGWIIAKVLTARLLTGQNGTQRLHHRCQTEAFVRGSWPWRINADLLSEEAAVLDEFLRICDIRAVRTVDDPCRRPREHQNTIGLSVSN